jgi:hypothetical protein
MVRKFREVKGDGIEGDYWKPTQIGESIEGTIVKFTEGNYGPQIVLKLEDEREIELPSHKHIVNKIAELYEQDYIKVTLTDIKKSNDPDYNDTPIYKVEVAEDE